VGNVALRILLLFICASSFSALVNIKIKARNKLDCEPDLRCALAAKKIKLSCWLSKNYILPADDILVAFNKM